MDYRNHLQAVISGLALHALHVPFVPGLPLFAHCRLRSRSSSAVLSEDVTLGWAFPALVDFIWITWMLHWSGHRGHPVAQAKRTRHFSSFCTQKCLVRTMSDFTFCHFCVQILHFATAFGCHFAFVKPIVTLQFKQLAHVGTIQSD